jgi:eukaryotic-like serine/threonine-protein kinase
VDKSSTPTIDGTDSGAGVRAGFSLSNDNSSSHDPLVGRHLKHYRVIEQVGQGGMSVVYRGFDEHLQRDVAIKVLHPFLDEKPDCRVRLVREARAVAMLDHPNVLQIFDFSGEHPTLDEKPGGQRAPRERAFLVMELVRGHTLKRFADTHQLWAVPEVAAAVVWQLLEALAHAHEAGVVHRDLKPENVMVRNDGVIKLMDFGIAHIIDQQGITVTGTLLGSPAHMAPECIDGQHADTRSDIYSMGTVLYWMLTGSLPFEAPTPHALLKQIMAGAASPVQRRNPAVSDDMARVVARSMATAPADRFETARAFADALADVLKRSGLTPDPTTLTQLLHPEHVANGMLTSRAEVRASFLERAKQSVAEGQATRALSALNRVLADDAQDPEAKALLEQIDALSIGSHAGVSLAASSSTSPMPAMAKGPAPMMHVTRVLRWAAALAVTVGMVAAAMWLPSFLQQRLPPPPVAGVVDAVGVVGADQTLVDERLPPTPVTPTPVPSSDVKRLPVGEKGRPSSPPNSVPAAGNGEVELIVVNSWADVYFRDDLVAAQTMQTRLRLPKGPQRLWLKHPQAKDQPVDVVVGEQPIQVRVSMEPRPAQLVVRALPVTALVIVEGQGAMQASQTVERAMLVPMSGRPNLERQVTITAPGHHPEQRKVKFAAGETTVLQNIVLHPVADDTRPPKP